jgi:mannose-6-phosphate isomerase-like protein (cupin superfamily)
LSETPLALATHVDFGTLLSSRNGHGAVWSHASSDLNVNFVVYPEGAGVRAHVNTEVDVLIVAVEGQGRVVVGEVVHVLGAGQALLVPKNVQREITALSERFAYMTCHRRRPHLWPVNVPRPALEKVG